MNLGLNLIGSGKFLARIQGRIRGGIGAIFKIQLGKLLDVS